MNWTKDGLEVRTFAILADGQLTRTCPACGRSIVVATDERGGRVVLSVPLTVRSTSHNTKWQKLQEVDEAARHGACQATTAERA